MAQPSDNLDKIRNRGAQKDYVFYEYPKFIMRKDGTRLLVEDKYEHENIIAQDDATEDSPPKQEELIVTVTPNSKKSEAVKPPAVKTAKDSAS